MKRSDGGPNIKFTVGEYVVFQNPEEALMWYANAVERKLLVSPAKDRTFE